MNDSAIRYTSGDGCVVRYPALALMFLTLTGMVMLAIGCMWLVWTFWNHVFVGGCS